MTDQLIIVFAKESFPKVNEDIPDVSEFCAHDLVGWMKWFISLGAVVMGQIDLDVERTGATLTKVFIDSVLRLENDPLYKTIGEAGNTHRWPCGSRCVSFASSTFWA